MPKGLPKLLGHRCCLRPPASDVDHAAAHDQLKWAKNVNMPASKRLLVLPSAQGAHCLLPQQQDHKQLHRASQTP